MCYEVWIFGSGEYIPFLWPALPGRFRSSPTSCFVEMVCLWLLSFNFSSNQLGWILVIVCTLEAGEHFCASVCQYRMVCNGCPLEKINVQSLNMWSPQCYHFFSLLLILVCWTRGHFPRDRAKFKAIHSKMVKVTFSCQKYFLYFFCITRHWGYHSEFGSLLVGRSKGSRGQE